jgi:hypothetical protein
VVKQQASQVTELLDGEVGTSHGLHPFLPSDPYAHVGRADHTHVVRSVSTVMQKPHPYSLVTDREHLLP